ncbi:PRD domain-containing protein [Lactobacillus sp. ESL0791]|uniref:PRD domain-containing protein n=1 Tax=Lactobacillus sp. ESL0791 TaxID=2983234 RepID=UPI0023F8583C|nr:PRD domain-containing protein [Lactobacillus sp. ESL0791]MDF7639364.1 PRD domain-containing protein [Lactobacillus sp. ESL0791]
MISQVLNNNVLLVEDGKNQEQIIWGRGIGFKAHSGQNYDPQPSDKVFSSMPQTDDKWISSFKQLSDKIPREYFELTDKIIQLARKEIDSDFDEHLLLPLTDHIYFAVERIKQGLNLFNPMLFDLKRFFTKEYGVGKQAQKMIEQLSGVKVSDDEAGFIAMHLVEHEMKRSNGQIKNFSNIMNIFTDITNIIESVFGRKFSENDVSLTRLMTHLYYLILRSNTKEKYSGLSSDSALLKDIMSQHQKAGICLKQITKYLEQKIDYHFNDSDRLYLLIHIIHIAE